MRRPRPSRLPSGAEGGAGRDPEEPIVDCALTEFLPAERTAPAELERQCRRFSDAWFFGELLHYVPDMVLILNAERQIVYANRAALGVAGAETAAAITGQRPGEAFHCRHGTESAGGCGTTAFCRYCGAAKSIARSQQGAAAVDECRMTIVRDGDEAALDLRVWASPMEVDGERFTFFVLSDIADEKRRHILERIFLHDLTNTASALLGFSELLGFVGLEPGMRDEYTSRIADLSGRILDEIEAHRQLVAAEHGELRLDVRTIWSRPLLDEMHATYSRPDVLDHRRLVVAADAADTEFESDPTLLRRVAGNMVKNAIEASAPGETVTMGCRLDAGGVAFWVHNPTYMPENVRLQVFSRSFSTKGAGRGLGTYSMKFLTERYLSGRIAFASSESGGTTFTVWIPVRR